MRTFQFPQKLLLVLILIAVCTTKSVAIDLCPTIDFNTLTCGSLSATTVYEINNYSNVKKVIWTVEGGEIIQIGDDYSAQSFGSSFCLTSGYDWEQQATNFTSISYDRENNGSATFFDNVTQSVKTLSQEGNGLFNNNFAKKITILWHPLSSVRRITIRGEGLGAFSQCGSSQTTKDIVITPYISSSFALSASQTNLFCNQGVTISGAPSNGDNYTWNTNGGVIQNSWNGGINISRFTNDGIVPITVTVGNQCNSVSKTINLNITQPDFGHVQQNGTNVDEPGQLVSLDCQGNFSLTMPVWVGNYTVYTWELPGANGYDNQTSTYDKTIVSGVNKQSVQGKLPTGGLTDFVGKVTITGVCGNPVVRTFIIRPTLQPTVDADIYSCSNSVAIKVNNPIPVNTLNAWVTSAPSGGSATFTNYTTTSITFTASKPGDYGVKIGINTAGGCYTELQTTVHAGTASGNSNTGTAGWQSGVLSDNRKAPGSNIVSYGSNIYFAGRDGIIYYYSFSAALQKWVINQIPGISNAAIPAAGAFTKIGVAKIGTTDYLFYTDNSGFFKKINLATFFTDDALVTSTLSKDFIVTTDAIYAIETGANTLISNQIPSIPFANASLKILIPGIGISYIQNNNLFVTGINYALSPAGDVYPNSDVVYFNGWLYYARGQKGVANLYRLQINNPAGTEQITTSSNLSGVFTINPASGVIYYGVLNAGAINTTYTVSSGMYKSANIYQAHLSGSTWLFNAATLFKPREELDMFIQSPVYTGNHLYYIGAGHNIAVGDSYELEVWNLYYENSCAPALQRTASTNIEGASTSNVTVYPNPFSNTLQLDLSGYSDPENGAQTNVDIEIIDVTGKTVYKQTVLSEPSVLPTSEWTAGVYLVKIKQNNNIHTQKVIKVN